jgi:hypothetical protein
MPKAPMGRHFLMVPQRQQMSQLPSLRDFGKKCVLAASVGVRRTAITFRPFGTEF